jgi:hypothetical protein
VIIDKCPIHRSQQNTILKIKGDKIEKVYINIHDDSYLHLPVRRNNGSAVNRWRNY